MIGDSWKRPSLVLAAWVVLLLAVFVVRGDLRVGVDPAPRPAAATNGREAPVVVRARPASTASAERGRPQTARVFDAAGFLVVGADVSVGGRDAARTGADGTFTLELRDGASEHVLVRARGHRSRWFRVGGETPDTIALQLEPEAPWDAEPVPPAAPPLLGEGLVRSSGGDPVVGAWVTAAGSGEWSRTDDVGRYRLPLWSKEVTLIVHGPAADSGAGTGLAARSAPITLARDRGTVPLPEIVAEAGGAIRGIVHDDRGMPVTGVPVRLSGEGLVRVTDTGPGGRFDIGGLQAGRYTVRPFAFRGALGTPHEVVLDRPVVECDLHLQSAAERRLRILDESGAPVAHAWIAPSLAGERTCVSRADSEGWAAVRVGDDATAAAFEFQVRAGAHYTLAQVRRLDAVAAKLVVALP